MQLERLGGDLGALISGVKAASLSEREALVLQEALLDRALLILPDQFLTDSELVSFSRTFGRLERHITPSGAASSSSLQVSHFSNVARPGDSLAQSAKRAQMVHRNQDWHVDSSFKPVLAKAVVLNARIVPADGGETEFADMRAAYADLDSAKRSRVDGFDAVHNYGWSQGLTGAELRDAESHLPPITRPLVYRHPETKQRSLLIGRHISSIVGLSADAGRALLADLLEHATRGSFVVRHRWTPGDLLVWDNRRILHRVRPWPANQVREMARTTVAGDRRNPWALP